MFDVNVFDIVDRERKDDPRKRLLEVREDDDGVYVEDEKEVFCVSIWTW